ncbi:phospholipase DDHD2-like isoform X2 [Mizuhopecten yessoensis]|uniref:SEC23-interacting protein n=1 Tax=Mizuhopecten yessoensis TaxID=6573 RepID=A0A210QSL4_MIZYE|nr:phospholipase DDHD2-like isoform X2 [Mizuhopecten yessoensis]OWF51709.1 SEC23-interacting protein [Mizuhopecten yessoensis]
MADRNAKDSTPPPLLFMPAGGGLTLNPPDHPNVLMPVIQSEPSLLGSDEEGEADSFVGQSPPPGPNAPAQPSTFNLFQKPGGSGADPFSQVGHNPHPGPTPTSLFGSPAVTTATQPVVQPSLTPKSQPGQQSSFNGAPVSQPMFGSSPAPPPAVGNQFRKQQGQRLATYAQMPSGTYAGNQGSPNPYSLGQSPSMMPPGPQPSSIMSPGQPPYIPPTGGLPPVPPSIQPSVPMPTSSFPYGGPPVAQVNPTFSQASFTQKSQVTFDMDKSNFSGAPQGGFYQPVRAHWCFSKRVESKLIWFPFSLKDSLAIEEAHRSGMEVVPTDGGRYDVFMSNRTRKAVYWEEDPSPVVRSSWFYKREGDNRYVPYEEQIAQRLENEYQNAMTNNAWHKRLEFPGGETVVMHNQNVMVHFQPSSQPDEWGTVQEEGMRPRVVKRGVEDFESIQEGEPNQVDHLVFMVHGIGSFCDVKFRNIVECVDDFRSISLSLQQSHFKSHVDSNRIGRVEFLPVHWHSALHGDATGLDKMLKKITLPSTGKLRNFVNDTLMDILFYTSPTYCQMIAETVGEEMNRLYNLFLSRNPRFQGTVGVAGHSLGSTILFDLLLHQKDPSSPDLQPPTDSAPPQGNTSLSTSFTDDSHSTSSQNDGLEEEESEITLEELLAKVGLQDKLEVFHQEQIDMESLSMCSEGDLKDLGLPMGPRKKLQGLLKDEQHRKQRKSERVDRKAKEDIERRIREQLEEEMKSQAAQSKPSATRSASINVEYIQGVSGTGRPMVTYPQLAFKPSAFIAMGSPIGIFLSARGLDKVGEDFRLPTCSRLFNIFHPFDPVAYRLEPLVTLSAVNIKPVLIPHHKGRKRLHLELKESLSRVGADIKQKIVDSLKSTWTTINDFAKAHRSEPTLGDSLEQQVDSQISSVMHDLSQEEDDKLSIASSPEEDIYMGQMNEGRRIDYVLQERPIESFNDYLFALASHGCYWESEDTVLLVIRELYGPMGILPEMPDSSGKRLYTGPPPTGLPPTGLPRGIQQVPMMPQQPVGGPPQPFSPQVPLMSQQTSVPLMTPPSGPNISQGPPMGIAPPLQGFMRTGPK